MNKTMEERFWSHVNIRKENECWIWTGATVWGYGAFYKSKNERAKRANRVAWELTNGSIPNGMSVLHHCDNPSCCNPKHLFLGTQLENMIDRDNKGRTLSGDQLTQSKLTDKQVEEIRKSYTGKKGEQKDLADKYGVSRSTICLILGNKSRKE